jgi:hypothetical protein
MMQKFLEKTSLKLKTLLEKGEITHFFEITLSKTEKDGQKIRKDSLSNIHKRFLPTANKSMLMF